MWRFKERWISMDAWSPTHWYMLLSFPAVVLAWETSSAFIHEVQDLGRWAVLPLALLASLLWELETWIMQRRRNTRGA